VRRFFFREHYHKLTWLASDAGECHRIEVGNIILFLFLGSIIISMVVVFVIRKVKTLCCALR
jgi:hypothetical protein